MRFQLEVCPGPALSQLLYGLHRGSTHPQVHVLPVLNDECHDGYRPTRRSLRLNEHRFRL